MAKSSTSYRPKWQTGPTRVLRVPERLADAVLDYAQMLDSSSFKAEEPPSLYRTARDFNPQKPVNVASVPQISPFRYPGGKTWLVPYIRSWLRSKTKRPNILIEAFAGGASVGLTTAFERLAEHVVLVEKDPNVAAVWKTILSGQARWLANEIVNFDMTLENLKRRLSASPASQRERAFATILRNRTQRGGILAEGAGFVKGGENGKGIKSRWYPDTLARRITQIAGQKQYISFLEQDAFDVLAQYSDDEGAFYFVDPPYTVAAKRLYPHWDIDHEALFCLLAQVKGDMLLTYDNTAEILALAQKYGFDTYAIAMKSTHHAQLTELLIGKDLTWLRDAQASRKDASQTVLAVAERPQ